MTPTKKLVFETVCPNCECEIEVNAIYDGNLASEAASLRQEVGRLMLALDKRNEQINSARCWLKEHIYPGAWGIIKKGWDEDDAEIQSILAGGEEK